MVRVERKKEKLMRRMKLGERKWNGKFKIPYKLKGYYS
jgi:hypothetical protein